MGRVGQGRQGVAGQALVRRGRHWKRSARLGRHGEGTGGARPGLAWRLLGQAGNGRARQAWKGLGEAVVRIGGKWTGTTTMGSAWQARRSERWQAALRLETMGRARQARRGQNRCGAQGRIKAGKGKTWQAWKQST